MLLPWLYDEVEVVTNDRASKPKRIAYKDTKTGKMVVTDKEAMDKFIGKKDE